LIIFIIAIIAINAIMLIISKQWLSQHDPGECILS
jgi:hypothetical protein